MPLFVYFYHCSSSHPYILYPFLLGLLVVVLSNDVRMGWVVMIFWAIQVRDLNRLPALRLIYPVFELMVKLKICWSLMNTFEKLFLFDVVAWSMSLGYCVKLNRSSWNNCSITVNIVGDFFAKIIFNSFQYFRVDASFGTSFGSVDIDFALSNYINPFLSRRLIK